MTARTNASSWRFLVAIAPMLGAGFVVFAVFQGEADFAQSPVVYAVLCAVACAGTLVAWSVPRRLAATPVVAIHDAKEGYVALRGRAEPLPGAPLVSTRGVPCVWFERSEPRQGKTGTYRSFDSAQPFLLVDATGRCLVSPTAANITGGQVETDAAGRERRILAGDEIFVAGRFQPMTAELLETLSRNLRDNPTPAGAVLQTDNPPDLRRADLSETLQETETARAATRASATLPALPVVTAPADLAPYIISADSADGGASTYRWLMRIDAGVAAVCVVAIGLLQAIR